MKLNLDIRRSITHATKLLLARHATAEGQGGQPTLYVYPVCVSETVNNPTLYLHAVAPPSNQENNLRHLPQDG